MIKHICPVCDQIMSSSHYCSTCRKVVKNPWIRDVSYFLNERHPESEENCSYHNGAELDTSKDNVWDLITAKQNIQKRMAERAAQREQGGQAVWSLPGMLTDRKKKEYQPQPNVPRKEQSEKKKLPPAKLLFIIFIIFMAFEILTAVIALIGSGVTSLLGLAGMGQPDIELGEYLEGITDEGEIETLAEADVVAAGKACTSYNHFSVKGADLQDEIEMLLKKHGYTIENQSSSTYNERYDEDETFFERKITYDLRDVEDADTYQYLEINSDTATGDLHEISMFLADLKKSESVSADVRELLKQYDEVDTETYSHTDGFSVYISRE